MGVGFGGDALGLFDFELFFQGWWTLFIIVPCVMNIFENGLRRGNFIGTGIGLILLLENWIAGFDDLVFPLILIVIGTALILVERQTVSDNYTILNQDSSKNDE